MGFSYKPILLDFGLRCAVLIPWLAHLIPSWVFYLLQFVGIVVGWASRPS